MTPRRGRARGLPAARAFVAGLAALAGLGSGCVLDSTFTQGSGGGAGATTTSSGPDGGSGGAGSTSTTTDATSSTASSGGGGAGTGGGSVDCSFTGAKLDGVDDVLTAQDLPGTLDAAGELAVGAMITIQTGASGAMTIVARDGMTTGFALFLGPDHKAHFKVLLGDGSTCEAQSPVALVGGVETHVLGAFTSSGSKLRIVVDGQEVGSAGCNAGTIALDTTARLTVGNGAQGAFEGSIFDVEYFGVAPAVPFVPASLTVPCTGKDAWWKLDCFGGPDEQISPNACSTTGPVLGLGDTGSAEPSDPSPI